MIGNSSRKDETLERLTNGIAQLTSSDSWRAWLKAQARFHQYSFSNTVLILCQRSTASRVAGFHTWRRLGRVVCRGESALWIFAPVTRRVASDDDPEQSTRLVAAFRPVPVFDISQTEGDPLPEICTRLSGDDPLGAYDRLVQVARGIDFTVEDHVFEDETNGDCSHQCRRIRVSTGLQPAHRVKTLCHELAHACLHAEPMDRALAELEAESVAFIVADGLDIQSDAWSFGYVASWSGGGDEAIAAIKAAGTRIQRTADRILSAVQLEEGDSPEEPG
jgi:N-terminal domain of anti-restriction factor ArdC/IrrE N-terminal-like domain